MKIITHLDFILKRVLEVFLCVCMGIMTIGVFTQIFLRILFKTTFLPIEDILPYSFSFTTFIGAALLFREKGHIAITFLTDFLSGMVHKIIILFAEIMSYIFLALFLVLGGVFAFNGKYQFSPLLKIPLFYVFLIVPVFAFTSIIFIIHRKNTIFKENTNE